MTPTGDGIWNLDELCAVVAEALEADYAGSRSRRGRDVPDRRTVRYYTTLGLLDRPTGLRGRQALYGRRHLLQLVLVKRAQAARHTLGQIQEEMYGRTDAELEALAGVPEDVGMKGFDPTAANLEARAVTFWTARPAPVEPAEAVAPALVGLPLADGVTLLVPAARPLTADDLAACRSSALPLLELLQRRGLLRPAGAERTSHDEPPAAAD
jgi:DNA-binding transcriptional MerR regulator